MKVIESGGFSTIVYPWDKDYICKIIFIKENVKKFIDMEEKITQIIKTISNNEDYFSTIIKQKKELVQLDTPRFDELKPVLREDNYYSTKMFRCKYLLCYPIKNSGVDLFYLIEDIINKKDNIWKNEENYKLKSFIRHMLKSVKLLHDKNICHLDIKPENIVYNIRGTKEFGKNFRLIDFGLSELYPFYNYINFGPLGTADFIPIFNLDKLDYLPNTNPNDWLPNYKGKKEHMSKNTLEYKLIYKSDVYSLGMTIYNITKYLNLKKDKLLDDLLTKMIDNDVYTRYNIKQCLKHPYIKK